jgi:hypothetical protein
MIGAAVEVELARQHWEEGRRRIDRLRTDDPAGYRRLSRQVELVADQLRRRVGQVFTLAELAGAYDRADDWVRDVLLDAQSDEEAGPPETSTVAAAAFHLYARGASDYAP